jgi:ABC-type lipoprotein export system ATPase subunit
VSAQPQTAGPVVEAVGLGHTYRREGVEGPADVAALRGLSVQVEHGETVAVLGPSGSGKSTLLSLLAGLEPVTDGSLRVLGHDLTRAASREQLALRGRDVGVLLQNPGRNLLVYGTVLDNLLFAQRAGGRPRRARRVRAEELLAEVGLEGTGGTAIRALSGGEQQRLAVAVALANGPRLLLADEPTSQLDDVNGERVVALLQELRDRHGTTVVVVTHDPQVADVLDRTLTLADGVLVADERRAL